MKDTQLILVVDDTPANLEVIAEVLSDAGLEVAIATDGERALKQVRRYQPDLILLDVMMPGIDGFETCRRLKADPAIADIPVIFMTALSDTTDKVRGFAIGAVDYITKPFQEAELLSRVNAHLKLRLLTQSLEQQVEARTQDLQVAMQELQAAMQELQQSQMRMVQAEKMAALGQLVAGVAHEINNPVNFIHGNVSHVQNYVNDLLEFVTVYHRHHATMPSDLQNAAIAIDLEFIQEDLPKTLQSMQIGTQRICEIVRSLRTFSRLDEAEYKRVDIHDGIDSTLLILQHRLKGKPDQPTIEVVRQYGELPLVECYAGSLNQVFMNVLANAIDALEEYNSPHHASAPQAYSRQITIRTQALDANWIEIGIGNNGPNICQDIQQRIFEPFFTTKPLGKGTGMGLSISHQIVTEQHHGTLNCRSLGMEGTEFVIHLPISQSAVVTDSVAQPIA